MAPDLEDGTESGEGGREQVDSGHELHDRRQYIRRSPLVDLELTGRGKHWRFQFPFRLDLNTEVRCMHGHDPETRVTEPKKYAE